MIKMRYIFLLLFFVTASFADVELFKVNKRSFKLYKESYPWLDELYLEVEGVAHRNIAGGLITVSLYQGEERIRWFDIVLKNSKRRVRFKEKWGPFNKGTQEIQPGVYTVKVDFILEKQSPKMYKRLTKTLKKQKVKSFQKNFTIGSKNQRRKQLSSNEKFYLNRMLALQKIFDEMLKNRNGVFHYILKEKKQAMTIVQWRNWVNGKFFPNLRKQKALLEKREKQFLSLQYEKTHKNLRLYCELLKDIAANYTRSFYVYYKKRGYYRPPYSNIQFTQHLRYIRQLHFESQKEMNIELEDKIGFIPPIK